MRIVFCGHGDFGYAALKALLEAGEEVIRVYTHPETVDVDSYREFPDIKALAEKHGVVCSFREQKDTARMAPEILAMQSDLMISVTWRGLFPESVISIPKLGAINIHGSLLPKYRGNSPAVWAMINGDKICGLTAHKIDEGMNTGNIVFQKAIPINYGDNIASLIERMTDAIGPFVLEAVKRIGNPSFRLTKQDESQATIARKRNPEDGIIDWSWEVSQLYNWVRALTHPLPGAFSNLPAGKLIVWRALPEEQKSPVMQCGIVMEVGETFITVQAGDGLVRIEDATLITPANASMDIVVALKNKLINAGEVFGV